MKDGAAAKTTAAYKIKSAFIVLDKHFEKHQHVSLEKQSKKQWTSTCDLQLQWIEKWIVSAIRS